MSSFYPPQIGFIPTGSADAVNTSTIYLGKNVDVAWEAVGFGQQGRPDYLQTLNINLTKVAGAVLTRLATISLDVTDVQTLITADSNVTAAALTLKLRQVAVCENGVAKKMLVLASSTYT